jgi:hypothetical protein
MFMAPVVPESRVRALVVVELRVRAAPPWIVRAPVDVRLVELPRLTVPEPPWMVRLPALVLMVLAALPVMFRAWLLAD